MQGLSHDNPGQCGTVICLERVEAVGVPLEPDVSLISHVSITRSLQERGTWESESWRQISLDLLQALLDAPALNN